MEKKIILWTKELSTGIAWQDFQHQEFLRFTNDLFDDFYTSRGAVDVASAVHYLDRYARDHFRIEERYMNQFEFSETQEHIEQHQAFREFVKELKSVDRRGAVEGARICNRLNRWFTEHIKNTDKDLGAFLIKKGQQ